MKTYVSEKDLIDFKENVLLAYQNETDPLIQVLQESQNRYGCVPLEMQKLIGTTLHISLAKIYGVVTFYSMFSLEPMGKNIIGTCMGTACYVKGAERLLNRVSELLGIKLGETTSDGLFTMAPTRCVGDCSHAPVIMINDQIYGNVTSEEVEKILNSYKKNDN